MWVNKLLLLLLKQKQKILSAWLTAQRVSAALPGEDKICTYTWRTWTRLFAFVDHCRINPENIHKNIHKVIGSWDSVIFVRETEERTASPITKGSNNTLFHISLIFVLYFLSQFQRFFLFLMPFHTLVKKTRSA